ncbi:hypothetical protein ZWY2020_025072 [Hordeum vulgare]|nr:hypothetical protein ZWY2020_025072 [Hordeum vulgare]
MGSSSSAALPTGRGAGRVGKKGKGTRRGGGRGRSRRTVEPSSPPPPAHSPEHRSTMVDPFAEEATGTLFQEPGVDRHSSHETPVQDQPRVEVHSAHETTVPEASPDVESPGWDTWSDRTELPDWTEGGDGGDELTDSEGDVQVDGATVYKRGSTRLPVVPATREQRPVIKPEGDRPSIGVRMDMRRRRPRFSRPSVGGYYRTYAMRLGRRLFETTTPRVAHHNKTEMPHLYDLYGMAHTASYKKSKAFSESDLDDPNNFTNISSHHKLMTYRDTGKATKGDDFNPSQEPLDPELVMISGGGRPHGSIAIGDGIIRCPLTLLEIKAHEWSSCPEITRRPRPIDLAIEAALQKERAANQAALEKERLASQDALQAALDERDQTTTRLIEEERARNEAGQRAMYELLMGLCEKSGQVPPPMSVFSSIDTIGCTTCMEASIDGVL